MQLTMGASLLPLMFLTLQRNFALVVLLLLLHAFAAATQDAAIDALSIACVPSTERGAINGWMQAGMLEGLALFGGGRGTGQRAHRHRFPCGYHMVFNGSPDLLEDRAGR